jgi:hypothetical protein
MGRNHSNAARLRSDAEHPGKEITFVEAAAAVLLEQS